MGDGMLGLGLVLGRVRLCAAGAFGVSWRLRERSCLPVEQGGETVVCSRRVFAARHQLLVEITFAAIVLQLIVAFRPRFARRHT